MVRKLAAMLLLSFLIIAFLAATVCLGADKPQKRPHERARIAARYAPVYSLIGKSDGSFGMSGTAGKIPLSGGFAITRGNPTQIGNTTYDYQHNCTPARQIEHRAGYVGSPYGSYLHMDWMFLDSDDESEQSLRGVRYQSVNVGNPNDPDNDCAGVVFDPPAKVETKRAGYCGIDAHNTPQYFQDPLTDTSLALPFAHEDPDAYHSYVYFDFTGSPTYGPFGLFQFDYSEDRFGWYFSSGTNNDNENIWPKADWDVDGDEHVVHLVASEASPPGTDAGEPQTCSYYRRVGPYVGGSDPFDLYWSKQRVIDTVMNINVTVASSPISDKIAVVWAAPIDVVRDTDEEFDSQRRNDVWFAIATDNGASWSTNATDVDGDNIADNPSIGHTVDLGLGVGYDKDVGGNLTTYDALAQYKAYCDLGALWSVKDDPDDYLQIIWSGHQWSTTSEDTLFRRNSGIFHWNQKYDEIRPVAIANWDTGGTCTNHTWNLDLAKPTITECNGKLYVTYTQFGFPDEPCGIYENVGGPFGNVIAGQLYTTCYDEVYRAWDRPQITVPDDTLDHGGTASNECIPDTYATSQDGIQDGNCNSEMWASMARYGRVDTCDPHVDDTSVLDIIYIDDWAPGGCVQTESGVWTKNPVKWAWYECRELVPEPGFTVDPTRLGLCYDQTIIVVGTSASTEAIMTLGNPGVLDNTPVSVTTSYVSGGNGNTAVSASPNSGITIPNAGGQVPCTLTVTTTGEDEFVTVFYDIRIDYKYGPEPSSDTFTVVPMCITVTDNYVPLEHATLATTCKNLRVFNNSEMSNNTANESLDFNETSGDPDDCATIYLYDGSKIICRPTPDSFMCWFAVFGQYYGNERAIVQASALETGTETDYEYAKAEMMTADSAIGLIVEWFAPTDPVDCSYMLIKQKIFNRPDGPLGEVTINGVAWGDALDWDIPGYEDGGEVNDNYPGKDEGRFLVWQTCVGGTGDELQKDPCDTLIDCNRYGGIAAGQNSGGVESFKNYMVLENDQYVYESGDESTPGNPYPPSVMYDLMTNTNGWYYSQDPPADTGEDLNTVVTIGVFDLAPGDTICAVKIVSTTKEDVVKSGQLKANIDLANAFILNHSMVTCTATVAEGCCDVPGDADNLGSCNLSDAVYLVNYIFKGGPAPPCWDEGDADGSGAPTGQCNINLSDAVYLINFIFKGGPPPICNGCSNP